MRKKSSTTLRELHFLAALALAVACAPSLVAQELAQLRAAAETGDRMAEYAYGLRIAGANPTESLVMLTASAKQEFGPAEDALGDYYFQRRTLNPKLYSAHRRKSVRWTSRAAYQGIPEAQARLAAFYETGDVLPRNPARAYGWLVVAINTSNTAQHAFVVGNSKHERDRLIANLTNEAIANGQAFADSFVPQLSGMNQVEADLIVSQLKLTAVLGTAAELRSVINHTPFKKGQTIVVPLEDDSVALTCFEVTPKSAQFEITGTPFSFRLELGR